ncbi:MAG: insulinase family protein [Melioribacteraceae bacterium]|nr:insulinase family protein [Melioribacteraceae bacterium]
MLKRIIALLFIATYLFADNIPEGFTKVKELGGITEYTLDSNGLTVLLMENHSAPVITFMVTYRVGSRNEVTGNTGSTHLLEHLMFKGTEKYNKANGGHIDATLGNIGARLNATTWLDRTNYYETIPSDYLELAVDIESDRMRNLLLRKEDKDSEMTVVRNEYERGENSPFSALNKEIWAAAFQAHPYHHSTIGWKSDIENVPMEDLRDFYNTFYWPNNATVTVIGDFKTNEALSLIKKYYGQITRSPHEIPEVYTVEPEQQGERRVSVKRAGQVGVVGIGHKKPGASHADTYPLEVLSRILSDGKTSRFYKALVDQGKAVDIFNFNFPFKDPNLFVSYAFLTPGATHEEAEQIILDVFEKIKSEGVTADEVNRAISQITAETAFDRDGSFSIANEINTAIAMGDWTFYVNYPDNIKKVTPEDVKRVVEQYFIEKNRTTGYFIPKSSAQQASANGPSMRSEYKTFNYYRDPELTTLNDHTGSNPVITPIQNTGIADNINDSNIAGIRVITAKTGVKDVVTFRGSFAAGDHFSPESNKAIADLTGNMLDKGTQKNDKFSLAEKLENLGASINFSVNTHQLAFNGRCLSKDARAVIELLAEQLRFPAMNQEEFDKLKKQRIGEWKQVLDNTNTRASEKLNELIFPDEHPNHAATIEKLIEDADKATLEEVKEFHDKYYGPQSMILVLVGDIDDKIISEAVKISFNGWAGGIDYPEYDRADYQTLNKTEIVKLEDKTSATLTIGQITKLKRSDPDYVAFYVANQSFGGGSFTARLLSIIRDDEGLTYGIFSSHNDDIYSDGAWSISGTFSPDLLGQGYSSTMRELKRWIRDGITEDELADTKSRLIGSYKVNLETTNGMARQILSFVERGFGISYMDEYPNLIQALTVDEVNNVVKKYIDPDKLVTVVAGSVKMDDLKIRN